MAGNSAYNRRGFRPGLHVVSGSTFDGALYQIALEDTAVSRGSSARIRKGYLLGADPVVVAVKVFGELLDDTKQQLLVRELHFAREVSWSHRYILAFLGTATLGEQTAIVSLYMKNGNLMEYIKSHTECNKKTLIIQVTRAVEFLHMEKKLVHGDLKCENVLVSDFGDALVADFGLSSFIEKSEALSTTITAIRRMNTVQFAAPELLGIPEDAGDSQSRLSEDEDPPISKKTTESDVYAFGMLILQAMYEQPPWGKKNPNAVIRTLSAGQCPQQPTWEGAFIKMSHSWWDICRSCWRFKPRERPDITDVLRGLKATDPMPRRELPFKESVASAAYTPDGSTIIAASYRGPVMLLDISTDRIRQLSNVGEDLEPDKFVRLAISPDGARIACCVRETVLVLETAAGALVTSVQHDRFPSCVAYSRDGTRIASGTCDGTVHLWDAATGAAVGRRLEGHMRTITDVSFSPDGICLASASNDGTIRLWDSKTCTPMATLKLPDSEDSVYSMQFSPDGTRIVAGDDAGMVAIWDMCQRRAAHIFSTRCGAALSVVFSPSGRYVASGADDGEIRIWDAQDGNRVGTLLVGPSMRLLSIAFSPDGKSLVSTSWDWKVRVWDLFV